MGGAATRGRRAERDEVWPLARALQLATPLFSPSSLLPLSLCFAFLLCTLLALCLGSVLSPMPLSLVPIRSLLSFSCFPRSLASLNLSAAARTLAVCEAQTRPVQGTATSNCPHRDLPLSETSLSWLASSSSCRAIRSFALPRLWFSRRGGFPLHSPRYPRPHPSLSRTTNSDHASAVPRPLHGASLPAALVLASVRIRLTRRTRCVCFHRYQRTRANRGWQHSGCNALRHDE